MSELESSGSFWEGRGACHLFDQMQTPRMEVPAAMALIIIGFSQLSWLLRNDTLRVESFLRPLMRSK